MPENQKPNPNQNPQSDRQRQGQQDPSKKDLDKGEIRKDGPGEKPGGMQDDKDKMGQRGAENLDHEEREARITQRSPEPKRDDRY